SLNLQDNHLLGDAGAEALAASPHLARLTSLYLRGSSITPRGAQAVAASPYLAGLTDVRLGDSPLWPGIRKWLRLPTRPADDRLRLPFHDLRDAVLEELAASPSLKKFSRLDLRGNFFSADGVRAFLASSHLAWLTELLLDNNGGSGGQVAQALAASPR